ncbi:MAG: deoxyribose-phosphate aldolase [Treponema sp.]|jgi:deoxyribose-phosphate aldolase|nr:deoxyribose-phosphate aldolase [Treponema sp.]
MTNQEILSRIDHTLLKATASREEIRTLCDEAIRFKTAAVCIPPSYVKPVYEEYDSRIVIDTVIGFPLGYSIAAAKVLEAERAVLSGAAEIDMVINIADVKNGHFDWVLEEIRLIKKAVGSRTLKVIVETCYLTEEEKIRLCGVVTEAGADYIKTSTGFGTAGAVLEDVRLFKKHIGPAVRIKAAGGIKTREDMEAFIEAGASRIGTSSAVRLLTGGDAAGY